MTNPNASCTLACRPSRPLRMAMIVALVPGMLAGCTKSDRLSRSEAAELIGRDRKMVVGAPLRVYGYDKRTCAQVSLGDDSPLVRSLVHSRIGELGMSDTVRSCILRPTEAGHQMGATNRNHIFFVPYYRYHVDSVTGVSDASESGQGTAQFAYSAEPLEWWATVPDSVRAGVPLPPPGTGQAMLRRYDDGWRVEEVVLKRGR